MLDKEYLGRILSNQGSGNKEFEEYDCTRFLKEIRRLLFQIVYDSNGVISKKPLEQIANFLDPQELCGHEIPIWLHYLPKELYR